MSRQIQIRRGSESEHESFTGAIGEVTMDTTNNTLRVHDGITTGGTEMLSRNAFFAYATNCLTEIPQDIKLELNNGALTLKAGSKVYVPNGINNFEVVQIIENKTKTETVDGKYYLVLNPSDGYLNRGSYPSTSGTTAPTTVTTGTVWYDAENNRVKRYSGGIWSNMSLPLCVYTVSGGSIVSIDQVFNGFGYIGSTVFVLPGVKGLIPNGRNDDGTLNNIVVTTKKVSVNSITNTTGTKTLTLTTVGNVDRLGGITYNAGENYNYNYTEKTNGHCNCGTFVIDSNYRITEFEPKTVFSFIS